MGDSPYKRHLVNLAVSKTKAGVQDSGLEYFTSFDTTVFADYTLGTNSTMKRAALYYPTCLKRALKEIQPKFAKRFYNLGLPVSITSPIADWGYTIELPSDYLWLIRQTSQADSTLKFNAEVRDFTGYSHTALGSDDKVYICNTDHLSVDNTADGKPPTDDGDSNWTEDTDELYSAVAWEAGRNYKYSENGKFLLTNELTNDDANSAYIEYIPYALAGINDDPSLYSEEFLLAVATLLASELELDFERRAALITEYLRVAKPRAKEEDSRNKYKKQYPSVITQRTNLQVGK